MPPIADQTEAQQRGNAHLHILVWKGGISGSAPSTRATDGSDQRPMSSEKLAYVSGYCTRREPVPQTKHRRGGETQKEHKTTHEGFA